MALSITCHTLPPRAFLFQGTSSLFLPLSCPGTLSHYPIAGLFRSLHKCHLFKPQHLMPCILPSKHIPINIRKFHIVSSSPKTERTGNSTIYPRGMPRSCDPDLPRIIAQKAGKLLLILPETLLQCPAGTPPPTAGYL